MPPKTAIAKRRKFARIAALSYRIPLPVSKILLFASGDSYPICPRCDCTIDREYMHFCDRCGQRLGWELFEFANIVRAPRKNTKTFLR